MAVFELVCLGVFLYLCYVYLKPKSNAKLPDGPRGIPIFGNALQISKTHYLMDIVNMGRKYGDAFSLNMYGEKIVMLNSYDMIREALTSPQYAVAFSGKVDGFASRYLLPNDIVCGTYSEEWSFLQTLVIKGLKNYGSNLPEVEALVEGETKYLIERIEKEAGEAVDPFNYITQYITSVISMLITGRQLKQEDEELKLLAEITDQLGQLFDPTFLKLFTLFPWLRFVPVGKGKLFQDMKKNVSKITKSMEENRLKRRGQEKTCFMDFMYEEKEKGTVTEENVIGVMLDLLLAGTMTPQGTLYSMFLILAARPDIQKRIQEEIDEVVGRGRLPRASDKHSMPYSQAFLWETLRVYPTDPAVTLAHLTMEDVHIRDYVFPKGTQIFYNIWLVNNDEKFWKDPQVFNPSRFLDNEGNLVPPEDEKQKRVISFGLGKRACPGESIARLRIFLALVSVLQNFNLVPDPSHPLPDTDPQTFSSMGMLLAPEYKIVFQPRNK